MGCVLAVGLGAGLFACGGASAGNGGAPGDEQDIKAAQCAPITTLTCAAGFESTTQGCTQHSAPAAAAVPLGRCVSTDVSKLAGGTYTVPADAADDLRFFTISFDANGTYKATGGCRPNPNGPSCFAITELSGTWTIEKSGPQLGAPGGALELVLVDQFNQKDSFFYTLEGKTLGLRTSLVGKPTFFEKR
jgi:hypothetical protein